VHLPPHHQCFPARAHSGNAPGTCTGGQRGTATTWRWRRRRPAYCGSCRAATARAGGRGGAGSLCGTCGGARRPAQPAGRDDARAGCGRTQPGRRPGCRWRDGSCRPQLRAAASGVCTTASSASLPRPLDARIACTTCLCNAWAPAARCSATIRRTVAAGSSSSSGGARGTTAHRAALCRRCQRNERAAVGVPHPHAAHGEGGSRACVAGRDGRGARGGAPAHSEERTGGCR